MVFIKVTVVEGKIVYDERLCAHISFDGKTCYKCGYKTPEKEVSN